MIQGLAQSFSHIGQTNTGAFVLCAELTHSTGPGLEQWHQLMFLHSMGQALFSGCPLIFR